MSINRDTIVEIFGCNGDYAQIAGPDGGDEGFFIAPKGFEQLFDPKVKVVYEDPGNWPGSRYLSHRVLRRDITLGVYILDEEDESWAYRDSRWRKMWSYDRDTKIRVTHPESKPRTLTVRLGEEILIDMTTDPNLGPINMATMSLIAGDPFWYEKDAMFSGVTATDTTFDPNPLPWPWPQEDLPTENISIVVKNTNPTDQRVFPKWTAPGSTLPPSLPYIPLIPWLGAPNSPAVIWTIPDYSFGDEIQDPESEFLDRRLRMPSLIGGLRTNEVQMITIEGDAKPTGGTWTITFDGETTAGIPYNHTNTDVQSALEALSNVTVNDIDVTYGVATNEVQEYYVSGGPTDGTYKLIFNGQTTGPIQPSDGAAGVHLALGALSNLNYFDVEVDARGGTNEVQLLQFEGEPTGGYFTITLNGETTSHLAWNATDLQIANALTGLSSLAAFQVAVQSQVFDRWSPIILTFKGGNVANVNMNQVTVDGTHLTGGEGVGMTVATQTEGGTIYTLKFSGQQAGLNLPPITCDATSLVGGVSPGIALTTDIQGTQPLIFTFQNNLSGVDVPMLTADLSGLTGGSGLNAVIDLIRDGVTATAENALIDSDPRVEQVVSESGSNLWARMNGVRFRNFIPPWTKETTFVVTVSGCEPGQMVTLRIPRPWSRPWGLE